MMSTVELERATKKRMNEITTWVAYTRVTWERAILNVRQKIGMTSLEAEDKISTEKIMAEFARLRFLEARALITARKACEETVKLEIVEEDVAPTGPPEATGAPATSEGYRDRSEGVLASGAHG